MKKSAILHNPAIGLAISLILCLACGLMSNLAQTDGGRVTKETLQIESPSGHRLSMDMLQPKTASPKHPAPAIVFAHGGNTNKEKAMTSRLSGLAEVSSWYPSIFMAMANPKFSMTRNGW